jgi:prophage regulatory protein
MTTRLQRMLRKSELPMFVGIQRTVIDEAIKNGEFPKPVPITDGGRAVAWLEDELIAWQAARVAKRDGMSPNQIMQEAITKIAAKGRPVRRAGAK